MMLKLVAETDPILKTPVGEDFNFSNPDTDPEELTKYMIDYMVVRDGIGLASPQIGLSYNVFVMLDNGKPISCFNPKILQVSEETCKFKEGCLSFPGLYINITRPSWITAEWQDSQGTVINAKLSGIEARCFQHELDHLEGTVFITRAGKTSLAMARAQRKKYQRR